MTSWRLEGLPEYAFPRLRALLHGITPGGPELALSIGEPQHAFPKFIRDILISEVDGYAKYPPNDGTPAFRQAAVGWLQRRYHLDEGFINPDTMILPLSGTREGLFSTALALVPHDAIRMQTSILIPNPFYQCYAAAGANTGAETLFIPALETTNFLPDYAALPADLLSRTAAAYVCSPANPQGTVADMSYWAHLLELAMEHDFVVIADECYAEIYNDVPPAGALEAAKKLAAQGHNSVLDHLLCFHSLSKRSNLPGLRSGFVVGGEKLMARLRQLRAYGGAPSPLPVYAAATAAWNDDTHVEENRQLYRQKFDAAGRILGHVPGFYRPPAGFFLWLNVLSSGLNSEEATVKLWREAGLKVLPGKYLATDVQPGAPGVPEDITDNTNPGEHYIRIALVHDVATTEKSLISVNQILF